MKDNVMVKLMFALALTVSLGACSTEQKAETAEAATKTATVAAEATGPSDAEIAHVLLTLNQTEIQAAEVAKKAKNKQTRELANHIIKDHTAATKQTTELAQKLGLKPEDNAISQSLVTGANSVVSSLKDLKGKELDKAFAQSQATMHQTALDTLNNTLIPNADNAELKTHLENLRPALQAHLEHAKRLQETATK